MKFNEKLLKLRKEKGLSQEELGMEMIDLAEISGYNDYKAIYLLGMAFAFPANAQRRLWLWTQK